ncbi:MAG: M1 family aminopeptidase [Bryobacterales bacterium]
MARLLLWLLLVPAILPASGVTGTEKIEQIRATKFDPEQCYRVRDVFLEREDAKFYFTDGHLIFAEPIDGRTIAALFIASSPNDQGELLLIPPTAGERLSVARFTSAPVLNEKFRSAMMFFTDDTAKVLRSAIESSHASAPDAKEGHDLAPRWNPVLRNLLENTAMRILFDMISRLPQQHGFFAAVLGGSRHGRIEVVVEPNVIVGQSVWRDDRHYFETWCSFPSRSIRQGERKRTVIPGRLENYHIESTLSADLLLDVVAKATFVPESTEQRAFALELSEELYVSKLLLDGQPVEFLQLEQPVSSAIRRRQNHIVMLVLPEPPDRERYEIELHFQGRVVSQADEGVYYVGSRGTWYPKAGSGFTSFDMTFHYPANLDLVATGELVETTVEGAQRTSRFKTASPIRIAGFNLGQYVRTSKQVGDYTVEVCANREVESRIEPAAAPSIVFVQPSPVRNRRFEASPAATVITPTPPDLVRPSDRIEEVAASSAQDLQRLVGWFGAPAARQIVISPVPRNLGQGFPGLVYAATLSYFRASDPPLKNLAPYQQTFYTELLRAHEMSHQWWGNVVTIEESSDIWIMESLATYTALMLLEERRGIAARDQVLADYRAHLLAVNEDGETSESAGAIVLGYRLRSSKFPNAPDVIMYEKGAWILHMLRGIMGDETFRVFLRDILDRYRYTVITTDEFRIEAARHLPAAWPDPKLEIFFDQWIYGTGIPKYKLEYSTKGKAPRIEFRARLTQQNVPNHFTALVPVRIDTLPGRSTTEYIRSDGAVTEFNLVLRNPPSSVTLDPHKNVLAIIE